MKADTLRLNQHGQAVVVAAVHPSSIFNNSCLRSPYSKEYTKLIS